MDDIKYITQQVKTKEAFYMLKQKLLPFKIGLSNEVITPRSGLALYSEFLRSFGIKDAIERHMPGPGSNRGYRAWEYIEPILLIFIGGGRHIEDLKKIIEDEGLRKLTGMKRIPSSSTVGDWVRRQGNGRGLSGIKSVTDESNKEVFEDSI